MSSTIDLRKENKPADVFDFVKSINRHFNMERQKEIDSYNNMMAKKERIFIDFKNYFQPLFDLCDTFFEDNEIIDDANFDYFSIRFNFTGDRKQDYFYIRSKINKTITFYQKRYRQEYELFKFEIDKIENCPSVINDVILKLLETIHKNYRDDIYFQKLLKFQ